MSSWQTFQGTNSSASSRANPKEPNAMPPLQIEPLLAAAVVRRLLLVSLQCPLMALNGHPDRAE
jgi:hypothetical protein